MSHSACFDAVAAAACCIDFKMNIEQRQQQNKKPLAKLF